jgi:hypothetical protein
MRQGLKKLWLIFCLLPNMACGGSQKGNATPAPVEAKDSETGNDGHPGFDDEDSEEQDEESSSNDSTDDDPQAD